MTVITRDQQKIFPEDSCSIKMAKARIIQKKRLPVELVYFEEFDRIDLAFYREKQVQGWSRKKKEALIRGDFESLSPLSKDHRNIRNNSNDLLSEGKKKEALIRGDFESLSPLSKEHRNIRNNSNDLLSEALEDSKSTHSNTTQVPPKTESIKGKGTTTKNT